MTLKKQLIHDLNEMPADALAQVFQLIDSLKHTSSALNPALKHAGILSATDAKAMTKCINEEFNNIEGEW